MRLGLRMGHLTQSLFGAGAMTGTTRAMRAVFGQSLPLWSREMPRPASGQRPAAERAGARAVYFPSCISRVMGHLAGEPDDLTLMEAFVALARRAEVPVFIPDNVAGTCCGVPFSSKGYDQGHPVALNRADRALLGVVGPRAAADRHRHEPLRLRPDDLPVLPSRRRTSRGSTSCRSWTAWPSSTTSSCRV